MVVVRIDRPTGDACGAPARTCGAQEGSCRVPERVSYDATPAGSPLPARTAGYKMRAGLRRSSHDHMEQHLTHPPPDLCVLRASGAHRVLVVGEAAADRSTGLVPLPTPSIRDLRPDRPIAGRGAASPPLRRRPGRVLRIPPDAAEPSCNQGLKPSCATPSLILNTQQMHLLPWL